MDLDDYFGTRKKVIDNGISRAQATQAAPKESVKQSSGIGALFDGIGRSIGQAVQTVGGGLGALGGAGMDLFDDIVMGDQNKQSFRDQAIMGVMGTNNASDAWKKYGGAALNTLNTALDFIPATALITKNPLVNGLQGGLSGFADELYEDGDNFSLEDALSRASSGAVAGAVTGGAANKIGSGKSAIGKALLNNKAVTSNIGINAISGAISGGTSAGMQSAMRGGDILADALSGAAAGGISGGATGAALGSISKYGGKIKNKLTGDGGTAVPTATEAKTTIEVARTTPRDYLGNEIQIENPNAIQRFGKTLSQTGDAIKNQKVNNALHSKTASKVTKNNSINRLKELGYSPEAYDEAAKVSTITNRFIDDTLERSGSTLIDQDLMTRARTLPDNAVISSPAIQKKFNDQMSALEKRIQTGAMPNEFSVAQLNKESRKFGKLADEAYRTGVNVAGDVTNPDHQALGLAYTNVKNNLRAAAEASVEGLSDPRTRSLLEQTLKNAGANQQTIDYVLSGDNMSGYIRNTGLFEDARTMARDMAQNPIRRNAVAGGGNVLGQTLNASGVPQLVGAITSPLGKVTGGIAAAAGNTLQKAGASSADGGAPTMAAPQAPTRSSRNIMDALTQVSSRNIGATQGEQVADMYRALADGDNGTESLEGALNAQYSNPQAVSGQSNSANLATATPTMSVGGRQVGLAEVENALMAAAMAGDTKGFAQLEDLYNVLVARQERAQEASKTGGLDLTTTQQDKIVGLKNAYSSLSSLADMLTRAGGGQGLVGGNLSEFGTLLGQNGAVKLYNDEATALINTLKNAIGKTDAVNTDPEVQRLMSMIPRVTDTAEVAEDKLTELSRYIENTYDNTINTYSGNYSLY